MTLMIISTVCMLAGLVFILGHTGGVFSVVSHMMELVIIIILSLNKQTLEKIKYHVHRLCFRT